MLRISLASQTPEEVVLKVEGSVVREQVALLEEEGRRWLGQGQRLVLELAGVRFLDRAGLALLKEWWEMGVQLRGGSVFVQTSLREHRIR
jgi:ABC-type transporter Mla MlaB component